VEWYTQVKKETQTTIEEAERIDKRLGVDLNFGRVSVSEQVVAFARNAVRDGSTIDVTPMLMPETTFETEAIWFSPTTGQLEGLEQMPKLLGTLHAAEHTLIALLPLWAMCDRWDIGGLSTNVHYQTGRPTIFVYDGHAGGVGITARGFARFEDWVEDTTRLLQRCPCVAGCPSCVQSPKCGNLNEPLDKAGARTLLERMLA
jgi:DEAD/DEAH box helicase domain-containing protein